MARIRTIKPEFPQSESVGKLSRDARLLFIQLWTLCDDSGRLRGNSRMLASLLYPYDDDAGTLLPGWLDELIDAGTVRRYLIDGETFLDIPKWLNHQKIDKPSQSKLPAFPGTFANPREDSEKNAADQGRDQGRDQGVSGKPDVAPEGKNGKANHRIEALDVLAYLNEKAGRGYKPVDVNIDLIMARIKDGATVDDLRAVVDRKCAQWLGDEKMAQYLRPATLFNATKFAQYAGEAGSSGRPDWMRDVI